jgi:type I restriction enzyme M protein
VVRQKLVETGAVDVMIDVRGNFFYTRAVPCQLWFFDRSKERNEARRDHVLMLDARNVYRKVSRSIYDFAPEQQKNVAAIVWLHRGQTVRFLGLVESYLGQAVTDGEATDEPLTAFEQAVGKLISVSQPFMEQKRDPDPLAETWNEIATLRSMLSADMRDFKQEVAARAADWTGATHDSAGLNAVREALHPLAERCRDLIKQIDLAAKLLGRVIDVAVRELDARESDLWPNTEISRTRKALEGARGEVVEALRKPRYYVKQADWLQERFPEARLRDVEGLVKLVSRAEIAAHDWSLTPGRYVGVALEEVDEDFDFEEALRSIHIDLKGLNEEAAELAARVARNFEELGA